MGSTPLRPHASTRAESAHVSLELNLTTRSLLSGAGRIAELNLEVAHAGLTPAAWESRTNSPRGLQSPGPRWRAWPLAAPLWILRDPRPPAPLPRSPYREPLPSPPPTVQVLFVLRLAVRHRVGDQASAGIEILGAGRRGGGRGGGSGAGLSQAGEIVHREVYEVWWPLPQHLHGVALQQLREPGRDLNVAHAGGGRRERAAGGHRLGGRSLTPASRPAPREVSSRATRVGPSSRHAALWPGVCLRAPPPYATPAGLAPPPLSLGSHRRRRRGHRRAGERDGRGGSPGCDARGRGRARSRRGPALSALAPRGRLLAATLAIFNPGARMRGLPAKRSVSAFYLSFLLSAHAKIQPCARPYWVSGT